MVYVCVCGHVSFLNPRQLFDANGAVPATWTLNNNGKGTHCTAAITASASPGATVTISF